MNSNDSKWNKIKAIESELIDAWISYDYYSGGDSKYADAKVRELANKIYNIATEGSKSIDNPYGYGFTALTKEKVIYWVNQLPLHIYADDLDYCINSRDFYWEMYEYTNS